MRWLRGAERAADWLADAASVVVVGDRENDIYSCFARRPAAVDLIVRAAQDRALAEDASLFARPAAWPELTQVLVKVAPRRIDDPGRIATVALRAGPVTLRRPRNGFAKTDPETVSMTLVEAREINLPANEEPLHWRLLTTIAVGDAATACDIIRLYRLRWRIEEVFRALKSDGMRLEETQVHKVNVCSSWRSSDWPRRAETIQLVNARDGGPRPATDVVDHALLAAGGRNHRPDTGRQNQTSDEPPSASFSGMAVLDHCETWRVELLLQTARSQDNESMMGTIRSHGRRLHDRRNSTSQVKCVNPIGAGVRNWRKRSRHNSPPSNACRVLCGHFSKHQMSPILPNEE